MNLGNKLSELRKSKKLTQRDFAILFGISSGAVGMWETNKRQPDLTMLKKISDYYDVSIDSLLDTSNAILDKHSKNNLSEREEDLLFSFRQLTHDNQDIIIGDVKKYLKEQRYDASADKRKISGDG